MALAITVLAGVASADEEVDDRQLWFYFDFETIDISLDILTELSGFEDPGFNVIPS